VANWGGFRVRGDSIELRVFYATDSFFPARTTEMIEYRGAIVNDSTIALESLCVDGPYVFRAFADKPDSTNWAWSRRQ
jgi:hypothetical protein